MAERSSSMKISRKNLRKINVPVIPKKTQTRLTDMMKTIQDLRTKFKEIETLNKIQTEMKVELKTSVTQLENSKGKPYKLNESSTR